MGWHFFSLETPREKNQKQMSLDFFGQEKSWLTLNTKTFYPVEKAEDTKSGGKY